MRERKQKIEESNEDTDQNVKQLKILSQAIQPIKMTKDLKESVMNAENSQFLNTFYIDRNDKKLMNLKHGRQFSVLPILLYMVFTHKKLAVNVQWKNSQSVDSIFSETQKKLQSHLLTLNNLLSQSQEIVDQFLNEKKFKNLLNLIDQKMKMHQRQASRKMQNKSNSLGKIQIQCIGFHISKQSVSNLQKTLNFLGMFYNIFVRLIQGYNIVIKKMELKIFIEVGENERTFLQELIQKIGWHFWRFIFQIKSVNKIQVQTPRLRNFSNPISLLLKKAIPEEKKIESLFQDEMFNQILRVDFTQFINDSKDKVIEPDYLISLLKVTPYLKLLKLKIYNQFDQARPPIMKDSYKIFKTISQSNKLIESLCFLNFQLGYDQKAFEKNQNPKIDNQIENSQQAIILIDENLFWLEKMQESCPYLSGVRLEFNKKSQDEERRLPQGVRQKYISTIQKSSQIMNVFYHREMNNQTFFNTIKILRSEGFDYETILGVLDKKDPFTSF